ncbi:MAG: efflux RND transporter periplasmic adaptor subunit [Endozoicomonas sp.]
MKSGRWILTLVLCALLVGSLAGYKVLEIRSAIAFANSFPEHSETVALDEARAITYQPDIKVMGEVVLPEQITLRNELSGRIAAIRVKPGEPVQQGQVLLQQDISEEQAKVSSARARLELARLEHQRLSKLRKANSVSQSELDNAAVQLQVIGSELEVLNAVISKKTLKAPFDGVMGLHQLEQGSYLEANTNIASFVGNSPWLWVEFSVPQFHARLETGSIVTVRLVGSQDESFPAEVIARDPVVSANTRTHKYRARISARPAGFAHNSSVQITLPQGAEQSLISVSLEAVQYDEMGSFVYQLQPAQETGAYRAERRNVAVNQHSGNRVLIEEGLQGGEILAGAGAFKLQPGLLVYPVKDHGIQQTINDLESLENKNDSDQQLSGI